MLGAIIGDLAGSIYEYDEFKGKSRCTNILTKDNLIENDSFYSDDTILTMAVLDAILNGLDYGLVLRKYGLKYYKDVPMTRANHFKYMFSPDFIKWCKMEKEGNSIGNGALMRVSPVGYLFDDLGVILRETEKATIPSHNSDLAIRMAKKLNEIIYFGRKGYATSDINYNLVNLNFKKFDSTCLVLDKCFLAVIGSKSFEEAVRKAVSLGGDTDTIGAITGSIAEAYFEIPLNLKEQALEKLPKEFVLKLEKGYKIKKDMI